MKTPNDDAGPPKTLHGCVDATAAHHGIWELTRNDSIRYWHGFLESLAFCPCLVPSILFKIFGDKNEEALCCPLISFCFWE